jgi:preprotein translocase subunit SecY
MTNGDMRKRVLAVLGMILVFRFLSHVPIPLGEPQQLRQLLNNLFNGQQLFGFIDLLSGGALANFSIMLMGLGPYINASIIMQLLTIIVPSLSELQKESGEGTIIVSSCIIIDAVI